MDLLVSIVNMNNRSLLHGCLLSVPSACEGLEYRVVVIDNASTDGSVEMIREKHPDVEVVANQAPHGFGRNHNAVLVPLVEGELEPAPRHVCVLNDDTVLRERSLSALVERLDSEPTLGIVGPVVRDGEGRVQHTFYRYPNLFTDLEAWVRSGRRRTPRDGWGWLNGACVVIPLQVLRRVGLFDEDFFLFGEDVELSLRINRAG